VSTVLRRCRGCAREYGAADRRDRCEDCGYEVGWWCPAHGQWLAAPDCARCKGDARRAERARREEAARRAGEAKRLAREARAKKRAAAAVLTPERLLRRARIWRAGTLMTLAVGGAVAIYFGTEWLKRAQSQRERSTGGTAAPLPEGDRARSNAELHLGRELVRVKRYQEAVVALEQAIALNPESAWAQCFLADALYGGGDLERSISAAREALRLGGDRALLGAAHYALGRALAARGARRQALEEFRRSLALRPGHRATRWQIRQLKRRVGRRRRGPDVPAGG